MLRSRVMIARNVYVQDGLCCVMVHRELFLASSPILSMERMQKQLWCNLIGRKLAHGLTYQVFPQNSN